MKTRNLLTLCLFSFSSLCADLDTAQALKEQPELPPPGQSVTIPLSAEETQKWQLGYMQTLPDGQAIFEWIHPQEEINDWSELIQVQFLPVEKNKPISAPTFAAAFMDSLKTEFPTCTAAIISQKDDNILLEFSLPQLKNGEAAQSEIARIVCTDSGIIRIAFTTKVRQLQDALKKEWLEQLSNSTITTTK